MIIELSPNDRILSSDRIATYGDGCFTTMAVNNKQVELLSRHMERLQDGCKRLKIDFADWGNLQSRLEALAKQYNQKVLKVVVSRGYGGRGYGTIEVTLPHCYISVADMPKHYPKLRREGLSLGVSPIQIAKQPLLAGIKHLNRLEQVLIKQEMQNQLVDDVVVCDTDSIVIECSAANLFWRKGNQWFTPELDNSGVSGVMRNHVIDIMHRSNKPLMQTKQTIQELLTCDEAFVTNSLMRIVKVKAFLIEEQQIPLDPGQSVFADWFANNQHGAE